MFPVDRSQDDEKEKTRTSGCSRSCRRDQNDGQSLLRNPEQVSEALRGKIAVALDELGYIPNRAPIFSPMPPAAPSACCCLR
jgi:hypothetical protein